MSTFTDWNGPQGGGARAMDLIQLANAYSELVAKLNQHMADKTPGTSDVHGIKTYVEAQIATIRNMIPSVSAFITETAADTKYALKSQIPTDVVHSADVANFATNAAVATLLASYLKTSDLSSQQVIIDIKADIDAIEATLNASSFEMPVLKATDYVEGLVHAIEQVKFTDKVVATHVGGSDSNGKYWLIGMQTDEHQSGIALIRYGNTKPFSAVVNFAASKADNKYKGALTVVTDAVINGLKFKLVYGTDSTGDEHVYLAVQAPDWITLNQLEISASGINFCPIGSEGCILPNGNCHDIVDCFTRAGLSASNFNVPIGHVGEVVGWSKFDANGTPIDFPSSCHICDGSPVDPAAWPELITKGITTFPLVDYHIIIGSSTDAGGNSSEGTAETLYSTILMPSENGSFTVDKNVVRAGDIVTVNATPDAGYRIKAIIVIDDTETDVPLLSENTFVMPAADVAITVTFEESSHKITFVGADFPGTDLVHCPGEAVAGSTVEIHHTNGATGRVTFANNVFTIDSTEVVNAIKAYNLVDDTEITLTRVGSNFRFTMPDADVIINVDFSG